MYKLKAAEWRPEHFKLEVADRVATITLNRPERKNPLTFESYAELRDTFHRFQYAEDVRAVVITGAGGVFCAGGDLRGMAEVRAQMDVQGWRERMRSVQPLVRLQYQPDKAWNFELDAGSEWLSSDQNGISVEQLDYLLYLRGDWLF